MTKLVFASALSFALALAAGCGKKGGSKVGVAECDAYLDKIAACADKVGGQTGASLKRTHKMFGDVWRDNAKDASMKDQLPQTCAAAIADAKKQFTQCAW